MTRRTPFRAADLTRTLVEANCQHLMKKEHAA